LSHADNKWHMVFERLPNVWRQARGGSFRLAGIGEAEAPSPARGVGRRYGYEPLNQVRIA